MITIVRRLEFDAGHRVYGHEGKCANLHGHRFKVDIEVTAPGLDTIGRVVDFGVVKDKVGKWIDLHWDHGFILWEKDSDALLAVSAINHKDKMFRLPKNPTSENIAHYLFETIPYILDTRDLRVVSVTVHETPNCWAKVTSAK